MKHSRHTHICSMLFCFLLFLVSQKWVGLRTSCKVCLPSNIRALPYRHLWMLGPRRRQVNTRKATILKIDYMYCVRLPRKKLMAIREP
ncbi:hypothetical protein V8C42DRAFT_336766 [Trichoderma barbatum]